MKVIRTRPKMVTHLDGSAHHTDEVGGKAAGINLLLRHHYPVPRAFVLTTAAYQATIESASLDLLIRDLRSSALPAPDRIAAESAAIERSFLTAPLAAPVADAIARLESEMSRHGPVAVRSSATAEDLATASFAGQYLTVTGVSGAADLEVAIRRCWASLWMPAARAYRRRHHIPEHHIAMAVVVQTMVDPVWSGVAFTQDPRSDGHLIRIEAVRGLGEGLVSGRVTPLDFLVRRDTLEVSPAPGAEHLEFIEDLARLAIRVEQTLGRPQDIEWALDGDGITLLQVRPITEAVTPLGSDDGLDTVDPAKHKFTPHGVVEMIPGVVPPLLWTINAPMLEDAFRTTFADLGGEPPPKDEPIVARFRGRAALDLSAICTIAGSLPGGDPTEVERQYLGETVSEPEAKNRRGHLFAAMRSRRAHNRIVDEVDLIATAADGLARMQIEFHEMPVRRLVAYRQRIRDLAWRGYAAEVGASSAAGATYRALELLLERWLPEDEAASWAQILTKGALDMSPVGGARARGLQRVIEHYSTPAIEEVITGPQIDKRTAIIGLGATGEKFLAALDRAVRAIGSKAIYGDASWAEDEPWIWRQLQLLIASDADGGSEHSGWAQDYSALCRHLSNEGRWRLIRILTGQVIDLRFRWLRRQVEETIRFLELRERAKNALLVLGGEERGMVVEAARRLVSSRQLPSVDAIRYVTDTELEQMLFGACGVAEAEIERRRRVGHSCATTGPLPDWFVGDPDAAPLPDLPEGDLLHGWAASPGRFTGPVRSVTSLADGTRLQPGDVLLAHSTDPSWTPLFLIAGAVVLEVGGPLSHAAIVAREFGLPAVLNVRRATAVLNDGEYITVDGNEGVVERNGEGTAP